MFHRKSPVSFLSSPGRGESLLIIALGMFSLLPGCDQKQEAKPQARPPAQVSVIKVEPRDMPVSFEFVGQTQSSHQVEIRARVAGFLDKRTYVEGSPVRAGDVMFRMDPKPFQAQLEAAQGALAQQEARLTTARASLARVKPLAEQDALSQKDLDDAIGQEEGAAAAVETAKANVEQARLNLGYTTITTPVSGHSSYARVQDGAYVNESNSLLTYVAQIDPIWVNFSISENEVLKFRGEAERGQLVMPKEGAYEVEILLGDGSKYPQRGRVIFADAEYNLQTGTFLARATIPNPGGVLRPGQFVRAHILGAKRPRAILVPQRAVQQGGKGHFLWVVNKEGKAEARPIVAGDWAGNDWFINQGLAPGDQVVVDGGLVLRPGEPVSIKPHSPGAGSASAGPPKPGAGKPQPPMGKK